ncbi:hypothetical protein Tco_0391821, partial [Tanacetum coccineum]
WDDPFNIYDILKKKNDDNNKGTSEEESHKYPPGFTPNVVSEEQVNKDKDSKMERGECSQECHAKRKGVD